MPSYNLSSVRVDNPYNYVALAALRQALRDVEAYYMNEGTRDEIEAGKDSVRWIREMDDSFIILASATEMPVDGHNHVVVVDNHKLQGGSPSNRGGR